MLQETTFQLNGEVAVVRENQEGRVEVVRNGKVTPFRPVYTFDFIADQFKNSGWKEVPVPTMVTPSAEKRSVYSSMSASVPNRVVTVVGTENKNISEGGSDKKVSGETRLKVIESAAVQNIPVELQEAVNDYIELNKQKLELDKKLKELKEKTIRPYMNENGVKKLDGTFGSSIVLEDATASNSTSVFSDYELREISKILTPAEVQEVTEIRVNAVKLEGLIKLGKLPKEKVDKIKSAKIKLPGTPRFKVKK